MATELFEQATQAYARGRVRWAVLTAAPLVIVPIASFAVGHRLGSSLALGVMLLGLGVTLLWRGQTWARGLTLGLKAGLVPLALAHTANLYGHICTESGCTSLCVPACIAGGLIAGVIVALGAAKSSAPLRVGGPAFVIACLVGAFGCACVGFGGIAGMVLGTAASLSVTRVLAPAR